MPTTRLEAFSDGVLAIIITIMVLEMKVPHEPTLAALRDIWPVLISYVLSFIYIAIYWVNHHHLIAATERVDGSIMWANLHLLFWQSLVPFVTGWMGENHFAPVPTALYGCVMVMTAIAYTILQTVIVRKEGPESALSQSLGNDLKGKASLCMYAVAAIVALRAPIASGAIYASVAFMWLIPDPRVARVVEQEADKIDARESAIEEALLNPPPGKGGAMSAGPRRKG